MLEKHDGGSLMRNGVQLFLNLIQRKNKNKLKTNLMEKSETFSRLGMLSTMGEL